MAEIKITEKRRSWTPWIIGGIALAALIWFVATQNRPNAGTTARAGAYDSNSAAGTLAQPRDSAGRRADSLRMPQPR